MTDELLTPLPIGPFFRFPNETVGMDALRSAGFIATDEEGNESWRKKRKTGAVGSFLFFEPALPHVQRVPVAT